LSQILLIAFDAADAATCAAYGQATGQNFDILQLMGEPVLNLGAAKVICFDLPSLPPADYFATCLKPISEKYDQVAAVSSMRGKDGLPRLAGLLDWPMITDITEIVEPGVFIRPILAGSVFTKVKLNTSKALLTFRPAGFPPAELRGQSIVETSDPTFTGTTKRLSQSMSEGGRPDLATAKIVVSGGRPLKDSETFERIIGGLADSLGGAVGATRAAVDSGIAPNDLQVGQTGKIVAPDLYIAAGISGSTQHMAGIKDSKVIVAINTDKDAPIFDMADFGLVADLYEALPELQSKLS
jgi:electron transfer flavoprotein alpha subunit